MALPVETDVVKGRHEEIADGVLDSRRDDVILRTALLQHEPHRLDVVARKPPVPARVEVAEPKFVGQAELDPRYAIGDLPRHELDAAPRRLVVEQDPRDGEQPVRLAV